MTQLDMNPEPAEERYRQYLLRVALQDEDDGTETEPMTPDEYARAEEEWERIIDRLDAGENDRETAEAYYRLEGLLAI